jgi:hypothetical protein
MLFKSLDFHVRAKEWGEEDANLQGPFRLRINHIVDSFSMRIPPRIKTERIKKLNVKVTAHQFSHADFWELEGYATATIYVPASESIYFLDQSSAVESVKSYLRQGVEIACKYDDLFLQHKNLWNELISTSNDAYEYPFGITRAHRTRRWKCEAIIRVSPENYRYDILVTDCKTQEVIQRHTIKTTECSFPFYAGIGFAKLRWEGNEIVVLTDADSEVCRFQTNLPA